MARHDGTHLRRPGMSSDVARLVGRGQSLYSDADLIAELRRAAHLVTSDAFTTQRFQAVSGLSPSTLLRRFGSWRQALEAAGLGDRYSGRRVSEKMRRQRARSLTDSELLAELRQIPGRTGRPYVTRADLRAYSKSASESVFISRFGSWPDALTAAGLTVAPTGRYWTDDELLANLRRVIEWHGRIPIMTDMDQPPSTITSRTYRNRFGGIRGALEVMNHHLTAGP